jgi:hypothetical protein
VILARSTQLVDAFKQWEVESVVKKIKAFLLCLVLSHMCFASAGRRSSLEAVTDLAGAGSVGFAPPHLTARFRFLAQLSAEEARAFFQITAAS